MASKLEALEAHLALFGIFDDEETAIAIEAASDQQKHPEMKTKTLRGKERDELPDSAFGLPKLRKYPMTDPDRVKNAIKYFKFCSKASVDRTSYIWKIFPCIDTVAPVIQSEFMVHRIQIIVEFFS